MKSGTMMHICPFQQTKHCNFEFLKVQDVGSHHLENHKHRDIYSMVCPIFIKFDMTMQNGSLNRFSY